MVFVTCLECTHLLVVSIHMQCIYFSCFLTPRYILKNPYASGWVESIFCMGERFTFQHSSECGQWAQNRQICNWSNGDCCTPYIKKYFQAPLEGARLGAEYCHFDWTYRNNSWVLQNQVYNFKKYKSEAFANKTKERGQFYREIDPVERLYWGALGEVYNDYVLARRVPIIWANTTDRKRIVKPKDVLRKLDVNFCEEDKVREFDNMNIH